MKKGKRTKTEAVKSEDIEVSDVETVVADSNRASGDQGRAVKPMRYVGETDDGFSRFEGFEG